MKHIPKHGSVRVSSADVRPVDQPTRSIVTRDHQVIREWAKRHGAEPATGEATPSGPATVDVKDGGAGIRFNFPGMQRFRPIAWQEWLAHFDRHKLVFVYDEEVADRAFELWQRRGATHGHDLDDWLEAERQLRALGNPGGARYRLQKSQAQRA